MNFEDVRATVERYYAGRIAEFGASSRGVDWNSQESQYLRFEQLLKVVDVQRETPFSLLDYGCGYGALLDILERAFPAASYVGFDLSTDMVREARRQHPTAEFTDRTSQLTRADYTVASGLFSVKLDASIERWEAYIRDTIESIAAVTERGFAFNMLTKYSDADRMRDDLYYGDPHVWFDYCRTKYSKRIALLHDYPLYEFALIVRP